MKPVRYPEKVLRRQPTPDPVDDEARLFDDLIEAGVSPDAAPAVRRLFDDFAITFAAHHLRRVVLSLGKTPAAKALHRAILGADGRSLAADAADVGVSKQSLQVSESRIVARLKKASG